MWGSQAGARAIACQATGREDDLQALKEPSTADEEDLNIRILQLAVPALGTEVIDPLLSTVDAAFVGHLGSTQLGGLGLASAVFTFTFLLFNFLSTATAPLVAQALARDDPEAAKATVGQAITLAAVLGTALLLLLETSAEPLLQLVAGQADAEAAEQLLGSAKAYLTVRALGLPAVLVSTACGGTFRGLLDTRTPLAVAIGTNLVNLVLDPILIFGLGPVPSFGLPGAAAATVAAEWLAAGSFLLLLSSTRIGLPRPQLGSLRQLLPLLTASGALLLRTLTLQSVLLLSTTIATRISLASDNPSAVIAAHQVCLQSWFLLAFVCDALAVAAQGLVADAAGASNWAAARRAGDRSLQFSAVLGLGLLAAFVGLSSRIPLLFTEDPQVLEVVREPLKVVALMQPLNALVFVGDGILQGAADFAYISLAMLAAGGVSAGWLLAGARTLPQVWQGLQLLQLGRAAGLAARYWGFLGISSPFSPAVAPTDGAPVTDATQLTGAPDNPDSS